MGLREPEENQDPMAFQEQGEYRELEDTRVGARCVPPLQLDLLETLALVELQDRRDPSGQGETLARLAQQEYRGSRAEMENQRGPVRPAPLGEMASRRSRAVREMTEITAEDTMGWWVRREHQEPKAITDREDTQGGRGRRGQRSVDPARWGKLDTQGCLA